MGLIMLLEAQGNSVMLLTLLGALVLTYWDSHNSGLSWRATLWWMSLVLLTHVVGYAALRLWLISQRSGIDDGSAVA